MKIKVNNLIRLNWTRKHPNGIEHIDRQPRLNAVYNSFARKLQDECKYPFQFINSFVHPDLWRKLKLSLLLSLASVPRSCDAVDVCGTDQPIHVLIVIDSHNPLVDRLISLIGSLKRFSRWTKSPNGRLMPLMTTNIQCAHPYIQGNFSKGGIFYVSTDAMKSADMDDLEQHLSQQQRYCIQKDEITLSVSTECAVWMIASTDSLVAFKTSKNSTPVSCMDHVQSGVQPSFSKLIQHMDIVINLGSSTNVAVDQSLSSAVLSAELNPQTHQSEMTQQLAQWIEVTSAIHVKMLPNCQKFISAYVTLSRKLFPDIGMSVVCAVEASGLNDALQSCKLFLLD
ncbi:hypothetical protein O5D80_005624 [Batrachochytrium dendrobatidis]|nr:hypothetical protein O5D80_005624 [Batrachochytrium dendrobatidis]